MQEEEDAVLGLTLPSVVANPISQEGEEGEEDRFEAALAAAAVERGGDDDSSDEEHEVTLAAEALAAGAGDLSDEQLLLVESKSDAKALGKTLYKRWKKLQKKLDKKKDKSSSSKKKKSSKKAGKEEGKKERKPRAAPKKKVADDEDAFMAMLAAQEEMMGDGADAHTSAAAAAAASAELTRLAQSRQRALAMETAKKGNKRGPTSAQLRELAAAVVSEMQRARAADEVELAAGRPPLHRVAVREKVASYCQRQLMYGPLIEAGVLQELSHWLFDFAAVEPAPYELRTTALDILLRLPIEDEESMEKEMDLDGKRKASIDLDKFSGLSREDLAKTDVGRAVNSLRLHQNETSENRSKCVKLLQRLKRAFSGGGGRSSSSSGAPRVAWRCQNDPTVGTPFEVVMTGSQAFQRAFMQPDPKDPTSYHNLLPWRPPVSVITNMTNNLTEQMNGKSS